MLCRESVTTAIYVKCHLLARHVNDFALLQVSSALRVCGWRREIKWWRFTLREGGGGSIDPRLHSGHLPLPLTGWHRGPRCSAGHCQGSPADRWCVSAGHFFTTFFHFFLFSPILLSPSHLALPLSKKRDKNRWILSQIVCKAVMEAMVRKKKGFPL